MKKTNRSFGPLLACCCALLLCACARPQGSGQLVPMQEADAAWQRYEALDRQPEEPFRLQLSLRYGSQGDTRRVTALLWGNDARHLRLDVNAGVGVTIAKILEEGDHFLVFAPGENKAYFHQGRQKPLLHVGVPMPLGVKQLAELLTGRATAVFGLSRGAEAHAGKNGALRYSLDAGRLSGSLELSAEGLPLLWQEDQPGGWQVSLGYEEGASLPYKLEITHEKTQKKAIVLVKDRQSLAAPFTQAQMGLTLPEGIPVLPISKFKQGQ